jgi:hypothetical protein
VKVTEEFYDLDTEALELKLLAVDKVIKIFRLGKASAERSSTPQERSGRG